MVLVDYSSNPKARILKNTKMVILGLVFLSWTRKVIMRSRSWSPLLYDFIQKKEIDNDEQRTCK